jgi:aminobenzoyl-glutamate utilization protein B
MRATRLGTTAALAFVFVAGGVAAPPLEPEQLAATKLDALKRDALADVDSRREFTQRMVDRIFSFGELGFQEFETSKYVTDILRENGFTVEEGIADIPTAWMATWGSGKPVISLGADIDGIPQSSQKPGVAYRDPIVPGAPGHGEGHSAGQAVNVTAALAVKKIMERERIPGTLKLWPGVAEEQLGTKAYYVRDGYFKDVDAVIFTHVSDDLSTGWGSDGSNGLVSVEYAFKGESAHGASSPWLGRSALDAVELMNIAWNFRREHLQITQRSHYVITDGGDQPNVVPPTASVWYYFREVEYPSIRRLWDIGNNIAKGAALMTDTEVTWRLLGTAWPRHMNKPLGETMHANMQMVGMPDWSEADQQLARTVQRNLWDMEDAPGLETTVGRLSPHVPDNQRRGGGSDEIGDISWNVPTARLSYPANIPGGPGHNWAKSIAMATPIAHKGTTAGAKVAAAMVLDLLLRPEIIQAAWDYFRNEQTKAIKYTSFLTAKDTPAIWLNKDIMDRYRPEMRKYYFDPSKYKTYIEQLGISYPTLGPAPSEGSPQ